MKNNLGIPNFTKYYLSLKDGQNTNKETKKIYDFLQTFYKLF